MATGITAEDIQTMIQEALAAQAEVHRRESADRERLLLAGFEVRLQHSSDSAVHTPPASPNSSTRSTLKRTTLDMDSSVVYTGLGGTSTSALSKAAVSRASALASVSSSSTSTQEDFYKTFSMDQTKIEKSLI